MSSNVAADKTLVSPSVPTYVILFGFLELKQFFLDNDTLMSFKYSKLLIIVTKSIFYVVFKKLKESIYKFDFRNLK